MRRWIGNMVKLFGRDGIICITTNGFVKRNGECVMGKGIAKTVSTYWPQHKKTLGKLITTNGNIVQPFFTHLQSTFVSFPVKPVQIINTGNNTVSHMNFKIGDTVPGWAAKANPDIIRQSFIQLQEYVDTTNYTNVAIPLPGCGAGELSWKEDVEPIVIDMALDDRYIFCSFKQKDFEY